MSIVKKSLIALAGTLVFTGLVLGAVLNSISPTQTVSEVELSSTLPATVLIGVPVAFTVTVNNPTQINVGDIVLKLTAACTGVTTAMLSGDAAGDACGGTITSSIKTLTGGQAVTFSFSVLYSGSPGTVVWTINAVL